MIRLLFNAFLFAFFFISSLVFSEQHTAGDQEHYHSFYNAVAGLSLADAYQSYKDKLGTSEPIYFFIVYFASEYFPKNIFFSFVNVVLLFCLYRFLFARKVNLLVYPIIFSNYYLIVLLFSAERLKLALLFFLFSFFFQNTYIKLFFKGLSFFTHAQTFLLVLSKTGALFVNKLRRLLDFKISKTNLLIFPLFVFLSSISLYVMQDHIYGKFFYYFNHTYLSISSFKPLFFLLLAVYYAREKKMEAVFAFVPLVFASFLVGSERVTVFSYFIFLYYAIGYNRGMNIGLIVTGAYFTVKGFDFLRKIIIYGDGFFCTYNFC